MRYAGFAGLKNCDLLTAADSAHFDVLVTVDQGFQYEQNLSGRRIAVLIVHAKSNRLRHILPRTCLSESVGID